MSFTTMEYQRVKEKGKRRSGADYVMEVVKDLTCPICLEFYTHPVILPCSHVLCRRPCAENIFEINFIRCPVCRDNCYISGGIASLPRVITLESIIEKVRAERKKRAVTSKTWSNTGSAHSELTSHDASGDDADTTLCGRSFDFTPIRSPDITSSRCTGQSSAISTPINSSPSSLATPTGPQELLQRLNLQLNVPYHDLLLSSTSTTSAATFHRQDTPTSSLDFEIQNILCTVNSRGGRILPLTNPNNNQGLSATEPHSCHERTANENQEYYKSSHTGTTNQNSPHVGASVNILSTASELETPGLAATQSLVSSPIINSVQTPALSRCPLSSHLPFDTVATSIPNTLPTRRSETSIPANTLTSDTSFISDTQVEVFKHDIQEQLQRLCDIQCQLLVHLTSYRDKADGLQDILEKRRGEINTECDSLMAVVEHKRSHFVGHVDKEIKNTQREADDVTVATEKLLTSTQQLACFAEEILEARDEELVQSAPAVLDRLSSSVKECELCLLTSEPRLRSIMSHHVDFRNERAFLRQAGYLTIPSKPIIDVQRCTRNNDTVVLVIATPPVRDVIDSYEITYCSEEQKRLGIEERCYAKLSTDPPDLPTKPESALKYILIENLCRNTPYYFSACAVNREGRSPSSDHVQCLTLGQHECVVPVPAVLESSCYASRHHVTLCCPSPTNITAHQGVSHFALYRQEGGVYIWQGEELQAKEEHQIRGLRPDSDYQFLIIACNVRGECQLSEKIGMRTCSG